jgi:hypothetical protein
MTIKIELSVEEASIFLDNFIRNIRGSEKNLGEDREDNSAFSNKVEAPKHSTTDNDLVSVEKTRLYLQLAKDLSADVYPSYFSASSRCTGLPVYAYKLIAFYRSNISLIKIIREHTGLSLLEVKNLVQEIKGSFNT